MYYTMLPALSDISITQAKPTKFTEKEMHMLMDYCATYPNAKIRYYASEMILHVESDAAYLVAPNAKSRVAGYYYLSDASGSIDNPPIQVLCKLLKHVVASAAEAETAGAFFNGQETIYVRRLLEALGHPQPVTSLKTDNSTTESFVNKNMRLKRSKSWDMRYHWLRDAALRKYLLVKWAKDILNKADYYTKHVAPSHHVQMRPTLFVRGTTGVTVEKNRIKPARAINRVPARTVSTIFARTAKILPRASLKTISTRFIPPVMNKMTLQGCVGTTKLLRTFTRTLTSVY